MIPGPVIFINPLKCKAEQQQCLENELAVKTNLNVIKKAEIQRESIFCVN